MHVTVCIFFYWSALTSPAQPHSEQPHSTLDPPETSSLADSANHQPACWEEGLHHQMANPEKIEAEHFQRQNDVNDFGVCFQALSPPHWCHLSPEALCHRWYHRPGRLWWRRNASGPERKRWQRENLTRVHDNLCKFWEDAFIFRTSMKELSVLSVGLCVIRNLMFLWHSSTGAGRFMVTRGPSDLQQLFLLFTLTIVCQKNLESFKKRNTLRCRWN